MLRFKGGKIVGVDYDPEEVLIRDLSVEDMARIMTQPEIPRFDGHRNKRNSIKGTGFNDRDGQAVRADLFIGFGARE